MMEDLKNLARLQLTENRIAEASKARDDLAEVVEQKNAEIKDLTRKRNEIQDRFDAAKRDWREIEEGVDTKKAELKKWEARLQTLQDWREQQALNSAIREQKRSIEHGEENANEKVAIVEELEALFNTAQAALEAAQADMSALTGDLKNSATETETALQSEVAHRDALLDEIGIEDKRRFVSMIASSKRRPAHAVVVATGGVCSFCNVRLQPQVWIEVQRMDKVIYCQTCRRVNVHEPVMIAAAELEA